MARVFLYAHFIAFVNLLWISDTTIQAKRKIPQINMGVKLIMCIVHIIL